MMGRVRARERERERVRVRVRGEHEQVHDRAGLGERDRASCGSCLRRLLLAAAPLAAQERPFGTLRQQAAVQQAWLEAAGGRPAAVMRAHGVDMWVVTMREYNEDPVFRGLVSATTFAARRRIHLRLLRPRPAAGVERLALGGTSRAGCTVVVPRRAGAATAPEGGAVGHGPVAAVRAAGERAKPQGDRPQHLRRPQLRRRPHGRRMGADEGRRSVPSSTAASSATPAWRSTTWRCGCPSMAPRLPAAPGDRPRGDLGTAFSNLVITPGVTRTRGRGVVDAPAGQRPGPRHLVPAVDRGAAAGRDETRSSATTR